MQETTTQESIFDVIMLNYRIKETVQAADKTGWPDVWQNFDSTCENVQFQNEQDKNIFIDLFMNECLLAISPAKDLRLFLEMLEKWFATRKLEKRSGGLQQDEKIALVHICVNLRVKLREFILHVPYAELDKLDEYKHQLLIGLWRQLFFEPFSVLNLSWNPSHAQPEITEPCRRMGYQGALIASMYEPFSADEYCIDAEHLTSSSVPYCYKAILFYWMVNTPYFNAEERHRLKVLKYVQDICRAILRHPQILSSVFFLTLVQEVMTAFWRASYIGGNNVEALSAFGDLISAIMRKSFPYPKPKFVPKDPAKGEKLRIGYISRNFYKQAVSLYMVSRVIHHDPEKFEIYVFALGDYHDDISDLFKQHSVFFEHFPKLTDIQGIVKAIWEQSLDILIYTDIGMDPITYLLSGLQLAPIQCALVGHGTTTGMPTIQYYISGDHEAPMAQDHYRETLIRLPNLGAAQYMAFAPEERLSRSDLGIPEDAVVFISCANGIKHPKSRDRLLVEILKQAPNAWVILKPFATNGSIDLVYSARFKEAAQAAGVADRLLILPPIGHSKHVMGILSISDVQLDTYPYGGWTTNMEALYVGLPIVTQEGDLARSRWGAGMLRALGICEGIAANEDEYVQWAVTFAENAELRQRLSQQIKTNVAQILFNGLAAQSAYEETLLTIYQQTIRDKALKSAFISHHQDQITVATSVRPSDFENQREALESWKRAGFHIVSINVLDEIALLYPQFPDITFIAAETDTREKYGHPFVSFNDFLTYFRTRSGQIYGIISPDIHLRQHDFYNFVSQEAVNSFLFGSRADVDTLSSDVGKPYQIGFDYFFFDATALQYYPLLDVCFGLPWWDYWAVLNPLMHKMTVKRVVDQVALHIKHPPLGDKQTWLENGFEVAQHFRPPFELTPETMTKYAQETWTIITKLSEEISL